jgi:ABC-type branched-subunit amino acid transport system substrate-binding protein
MTTGTATFAGVAALFHMFTSSRHLVAMAFLSLIVVLTGGCATRAEPAPIWIGHVATLSGPDRQAGEAAVYGIRLAVEEINKDISQGLGRPLQVIHGDARGSLEYFEAEAVRLSALNRVHFLYGGTTAEEVERLNRAPALVMTPLGARTRTMNDAVFSIGLAPAQQAGALADKSKDGEAGRAVLIAGKAGDLRGLGPLPMPVLFAGDDGAAAALTAARAPTQTIYFATAFAVDDDQPRAVEFAKRYREAFNREPDVHAALAYEGMKLLADALMRSKDGLTTARVQSELKKMKDVAGLAGPLSFSEQRQVQRAAFVIRLSDSGAKVVKRVGPDG